MTRFLVLPLVLVLAGTTLPIAPAQAVDWGQLVKVIFSSDRGRGSARNRPDGGSTRGGNCTPQQEGGLRALIPGEDWGATAQPEPTFWFYIPFQSSHQRTQPLQARFVLLNEQREPVLRRPLRMNLPANPGIVQFTLPQDPSIWMPGQSLQANQSYNWFFTVLCEPDKPSRNPGVQGWIRRTSLPPQPTQATLQTQLQLAIEQKLGYDVLTFLAKTRNEDGKAWEQFLQAVGLTQAHQMQVTVLQP